MASHSQVTKKRRSLRDRRSGRKRKKLLRKNGTTPKFAVHPGK